MAPEPSLRTGALQGLCQLPAPKHYARIQSYWQAKREGAATPTLATSPTRVGVSQDGYLTPKQERYESVVCQAVAVLCVAHNLHCSQDAVSTLMPPSIQMTGRIGGCLGSKL
jgi:hypothetical protein